MRGDSGAFITIFIITTFNLFKLLVLINPTSRRKVALPFLFLFLQVFSVFSEKRFLPFCMGNFKKKGAKYFSLSLSPGFLSFLRERFSLFFSTLNNRFIMLVQSYESILAAQRADRCSIITSL
jgi:hypothetical protein